MREWTMVHGQVLSMKTEFPLEIFLHNWSNFRNSGGYEWKL